MLQIVKDVIRSFYNRDCWAVELTKLTLSDYRAWLVKQSEGRGFQDNNQNNCVAQFLSEYYGFPIETAGVFAVIKKHIILLPDWLAALKRDFVGQPYYTVHDLWNAVSWETLKDAKLEQTALQAGNRRIKLRS